MHHTHHTIEVPGLRLRALEWGERRAAPLVLLHGGRDHAHAWDATAMALAQQWRVIVPDLRGHGDSDWSREGHYSKRDMVGDLVAITTALDAGRVALVGHSLGANVALHYAAAFPEKVHHLVAIEGMMRSPEAEAAFLAADAAGRLRAAVERSLAPPRVRRRYPDIDAAMARLADINPVGDPALLRHLAQTGTRRNRDGSLSWKHDPRIGAGPLTDGDPGEFATILNAIACPVLLIYGENSSASRPSRDGRLAWIRDAEEAVIAEVGHWVQHEAPDALFALLNRFLSPQEP